MSARHFAKLWSLVAVLSLLACTSGEYEAPDARPRADAAADSDGGPPACTECHGDSTSIAPPFDTKGNVDTTFRGVGAHRSHVGLNSDWHREVQCADCHLVPLTPEDVGHDDTELPAELTWGPVAKSNGAVPMFDGVTTTCSGVYCHGDTLLGGSNTTPNWTTVDGTEAACNACHGIPPATPHPANSNCSACHPTVDDTLTFVTPERHIDGFVDLTPGIIGCTECHGTKGKTAAPPRDTIGNTETTDRGVGAHASHLKSSTWHKVIACEACHVVPTHQSDVGHNDTVWPAELTWGPLAKNDEATPSFDGATTTCSGVYCHGATLVPGGSNTTPDWTTVDGTQGSCGTCHGLPPQAPHPQNTACLTCHPTITDAFTFTAPERHIDGRVDLISGPAGCTMCHGSDGVAAPPTDTNGNTDTALRGVGAHRSHLGTSTWRKEITCNACHVVPVDAADVGHRDTPLPAELTWGALSVTDGATPSFDGATTTCSGVYCHGATLLPGGTNTTPDWTSVGTGEAACGTCHGLPPGGTHATSTACQACHGAVVDASKTIIAPELHVNGLVDVSNSHPTGWVSPTQHGVAVNTEGYTNCQACHGTALDGGSVGISCDSCHSNWKTNCTFCHGGTDNATGAPPESVAGVTTRTVLSVGAHTEHVSDTSIHLGWNCDQCHVTPTSALSAGHIDGDGRAEVSFGALNPAGTYAPASGTCAELYCHGNGSSLLGSKVWSTDSTTDCGSCHANFAPPDIADLQAMSGKHDTHVRLQGYSCDTCHGANVDATGNLRKLDRHIDGLVDVTWPAFDPNACVGAGECGAACHAARCWN